MRIQRKYLVKGPSVSNLTTDTCYVIICLSKIMKQKEAIKNLPSLYQRLLNILCLNISSHLSKVKDIYIKSDFKVLKTIT